MIGLIPDHSFTDPVSRAVALIDSDSSCPAAVIQIKTVNDFFLGNL